MRISDWSSDVCSSDLIGLAAICAIGVPLLIVESKTAFLILGAALGTFFGPVQAASRSLMARITPVGMENEMFGLYALSGKATAFMGPWSVESGSASWRERVCKDV